MVTEYDKRTGTCPYWTEIENPREHRAFILYNVVFSGEYDAFTLSGLKERLEPYDLGMTDDDLRRELGHYVDNGQLEARIDGWAVRKTDVCGRRWTSILAECASTVGEDMQFSFGQGK